MGSSFLPKALCADANPEVRKSAASLLAEGEVGKTGPAVRLQGQVVSDGFQVSSGDLQPFMKTQTLRFLKF